MTSNALHNVLNDPLPGDLYPLLASFVRSLEAEKKSVRTVQTYRDACIVFFKFLQAQGHNMLAREVRKEDVRGFNIDQLNRYSTATANNRFRSLQAFFKWLTIEDEIATNPLATINPPKVQEKILRPIPPTELQALVKTATGTGFRDRRDHALITCLVDTGVRVSELAGLTQGDVDLTARRIVVLGKGNRMRAVKIGKKTAKILDRYIRARARHRHADLAALWLSSKGPHDRQWRSSNARTTLGSGWHSARSPASLPFDLRA